MHPIVSHTWAIVFIICTQTFIYVDFRATRQVYYFRNQVFQFFSFNRTFLAARRWFDFKITLLGFPLDGKREQSSTNPRSTGASNPFRILSTLVSNSLSLTLGGMPEISRHSLLKYCSFAKRFCSKLISLSDSLELTFPDIFRSALVVQ